MNTPHSFRSTRTERLRAAANDSLREALDQIEKFGFQVLSVEGGTAAPPFSYTVGVYESFGGPELITVGLPHGVAHSALNEAVNRMRDGMNLKRGRHDDLIGNVDVEFRPILPQWMAQVMYRADWFYEGATVPVLQMVYPDLQGRYEGERGFDERFAQPHLWEDGAGSKESATADFWLAHDPSSSLHRWPFEDGPHTAAYLSQTVYDGVEPIVYVSRNEDGDWQFLGESMSSGGGPVIVCLHHPVDADASLREVADLPQGWYAERADASAPWQRAELTSDEDE